MCCMNGVVCCFCLAHDLVELPYVGIVMGQTEDKACHCIDWTNAWIGGVCHIQMWFVGPGIKHCTTHAAGFFEPVTQLGNSVDSGPGYFITGAAPNPGDTSKR